MDRQKGERLAWVIFHQTILNIAAATAGYIWGSAPWPYVFIVILLWLGNLCALLIWLKD